ncbi:catalase, partial [Saitozyma sp. JCM 24511]
MTAEAPIYTLSEGCPYADPSTAQRFGNSPVKGLMLLQDTQLIETLAHFSRERIPERTVHAAAVGAWGEFEVTHDNSRLTSASFLNGIGKKSKVLLRISTVGPERGSAETVRDVRGWAMKIFTEEGNQDFVFNSIPVFFVRDPIKFPSVNRSHKRNPAKNTADSTMFWEQVLNITLPDGRWLIPSSSFHNNNQEGIHALMLLFSSRGLPSSLRQINSYSGHTYKLTKEDGSFVYVKFHFKSNQGVQGMSLEQATKLAGEEPEHHTIDMWNAIERGDYPSWTFCAQVMTADQAEKYRWNIFDMTKVWPHADFPLQPLGKLTLNRNPENYFADIEQAAFSPSTMVPGIAPSADPSESPSLHPSPGLLPRAYADRDGAMRYMTNYGDDPNYVRSSLRPVTFRGSLGANGFANGGPEHEEWVGKVTAYASEVTDDDFEQARAFWKVLQTAGEQESFVDNVVAHLKSAMARVQQGAM